MEEFSDSLEPDVILCDGHGRAHPRRMGLACHLGYWLNRPTIGCAKTLLCGEFREPATRRGSRTRLMHQQEPIGYVLRTRNQVKPVFVSAGFRCNDLDAVKVVLGSCRRFRLPEPIRAAHREANRERLS